MANNAVKVETDQLKACAADYKRLAEQYKDDWSAIEGQLNACKNYWQGAFASDFDEVLETVVSMRNSVYDATVQLSEFVHSAAELYERYDGNIARALQDDPSKNANDYPDNVVPSIYEGQILSNINPSEPKVSPNGFTNYNGKGNCTWYADNRWSEKNPDYPLSFTGGGSLNAKYWDDKIDKNKFNVLSTADPNNIQANAIAVSDSGTYGHVAYIESVRDGKVYFTEDGESYTRPHTWAKNPDGSWAGPKVQCCTVEEFYRKFGKIITKK